MKFDWLTHAPFALIVVALLVLVALSIAYA